MTQFNEPNRFCGECGYWLAYGEPETSPEQNEQILTRHCAECKAWRYNGIQMFNKDNVGQCWHCIHQEDSMEIYYAPSHESLLIPYCSYRNLLIIGNKEHEEMDICPFFKDRGGIRC